MQGQIACFFTGNCHQFNYIAGVLLETIPARNAAVCLFSYCNIIDAECFIPNIILVPNTLSFDGFIFDRFLELILDLEIVFFEFSQCLGCLTNNFLFH